MRVRRVVGVFFEEKERIGMAVITDDRAEAHRKNVFFRRRKVQPVGN
jgi:hypothetical protein